MIKSIQIESEQAVLIAIQNGDKKVLNDLYHTYRMDFVRFGKRYIQDETAILDTYQDAFVVFFENTTVGKLDNLTSSIKTYIFGVGKYMLIKKFKDSLKEQTNESMEDFELIQDDIQDTIVLNHRQEQIAQAISELGESCKQLLLLFYYKKYALDAIQVALNLKNTNVVKTKKKRCLNYLKKIIVEKYSDLA